LEAINGATGLGPVAKKRKVVTLDKYFTPREKENEEEKKDEL
jgi:hypothetical protein